LSAKNRDATFSYGYRRFSLLGAVINSLVLVIGSVFVLQEGHSRCSIPRRPTPGACSGWLCSALRSTGRPCCG
jgi:cobalt-zinc-cadmium efflux system protein